MKTDLIEKRMLEESRRQVIVGAEWLTADDLLQRYHIGSEDVDALLREKRIFAIEYGGQTLFPSYALNPYEDYRPQSTLREIILVFDQRKDSWGIAFWFCGACGMLGGQRPQYLLQSSPQLVLAAARDEAAGLTHG